MMRSLLAIAVVATLLMSGCSEDSPTNPTSDAANTFRLNGSGYSNKLFTAPSSEQGVFAIETSDGTGTAGLLAIDGLDVYGVSIVMQDVKTGSFTVNATSGVALSLTITKNGAVESWFARTGTIKVDTWAGPGGRAKGSFDATLEKGSSTMTIKGNFDDASITLEE